MNAARFLTASAIAAVSAFVAPAAAQVNDDAKAVLIECGKAMQNNTGITLKAKRYGTGMIKDFIDAEGTFQFLPVAGGKPMYRVEGRVKDPGKPDKQINVFSDGTTMIWLNNTDNTRMHRPVNDPLATQELGMTKPLMLDEWTMTDSFAREFKLDNLVKKGVDNIRGEVCDIIEATPADRSRIFTWAISVADHLPRRMSMAAGTEEQGFAMILDMWEVKTNVGLTKESMQVPLPQGYVDNFPKVVNANPANPVQDNSPVVEFGLKTGVDAPNFTARDASGKDVSLASLKGSVVVMEFWGTIFKQSTSGSADIQAIHDEYSARNVKVLGLACRENNEQAAANFFNAAGLTYTLIPKGDTIAGDYKVSGFPSYYVVNADGKVAAFFQSYPGKEKLTAAVEAALKH